MTTVRRAALVLALLPAAALLEACESRVRLSDERRGVQEVSATAERSRVRVAWSPVEGAREYVVYQDRDPGVSPVVHQRRLVASSTELVVQQVIPGTEYFFVVTAIVEGGETEPSGEVSATALEDAPVSTVPAWTGQGESGSRFGAAIASARDVNRDGRGDLVVGSPNWRSLDSRVLGSMDVFVGDVGGVAVSPIFTIAGKQTDAGFGAVVLGVPDVDGDGFDDVLVSEPRGFFEASGRVFGYHGRGDGLATGQIGCFPGGIECAFLFAPDFQANTGSALATFDDLTGDGHLDLFVGSPFLTSTASGLVELYETEPLFGSGSVEYPAAWSWRSPDAGDALGLAVAAGRDVTGDGVPDAVAGAPLRAKGAGRVLLFVGSGGTLALSPAWAADGDAEGDELGRHVALADMDCDGIADVVVAAPGADVELPDAGRVRIYRGGNLPLLLLGEIPGLVAGEGVGTLAAIGDVDADGCEDLLVGSPSFDGIFDDEGRARIFRGSPAGIVAEPIWSDFGRSPDARFGESVAAAGDADGDGFVDIAVGAPDFGGHGQATLYRGLAPSGPRVSAGAPDLARVNVAAQPSLAGFSDPTQRQRFQCVWDWGDDEETVIDDCTPQNAGEVSHIWTEPGVYRVRLRVERFDGVFGEAITTWRVE